jgi:hypothetical protein
MCVSFYFFRVLVGSHDDHTRSLSVGGCVYHSISLGYLLVVLRVIIIIFKAVVGGPV